MNNIFLAVATFLLAFSFGLNANAGSTDEPLGQVAGWEKLKTYQMAKEKAGGNSRLGHPNAPFKVQGLFGSELTDVPFPKTYFKPESSDSSLNGIQFSGNIISVSTTDQKGVSHATQVIVPGKLKRDKHTYSFQYVTAIIGTNGKKQNVKGFGTCVAFDKTAFDAARAARRCTLVHIDKATNDHHVRTFHIDDTNKVTKTLKAVLPVLGKDNETPALLAASEKALGKRIASKKGMGNHFAQVDIADQKAVTTSVGGPLILDSQKRGKGIGAR